MTELSAYGSAEYQQWCDCGEILSIVSEYCDQCGAEQ